MQQLISIKQATQQLGVSRSTIRRLVGARALQTVSIGRRRMIAASSVDDLARRGCPVPTAAVHEQGA